MDNRLKKLIIRKLGLVCVIFIFTLFTFYKQENNQRSYLNEEKNSISNRFEVSSNEENSFYFLTGEQRENEPGLGKIESNLRNPLNAKVQTTLNADQSLLRINLRDKLKKKIYRTKRQASISLNKKNNSKNKKQVKPNKNNQNNSLSDFTTSSSNKKNSNLKINNKTNKNKKNKTNKRRNKNRVKRNDDDDGETEEEPKEVKSKENKSQEKEENVKSEEKNDKKKNKNSEENDDVEEKNEKKEKSKEKTELEENEEKDNEEEEEDKTEVQNKDKENKKEEKIQDNEKTQDNEKIQEKDKSFDLEREAAKKKFHHHLRNRKLKLNKDNELCTPAAYKEFPPDFFGQKMRSHGFIIIHMATVCYMFFCLAVVCDQYFLPSLEFCSSKLGLSNDVAGATFMAAGSSGPELFTALLGVFIAKSDVGTGTIVGSAIFNILFVIGLCGVCAASVQLSWWPVARDSTYYCLTVFVLIIVAYDGQITTLESSIMLLLYIGYIVTMHFNLKIYEFVLAKINQYTSPEFCEKMMNIDANSFKSKISCNNSNSYYSSFQEETFSMPMSTNYLPPSKDINKTSLLEAADHIIIKHKRLFRPLTRFSAAANLILIRNNKIKLSQLNQNSTNSLNHQESILSKRKVSLTEEIEEYWRVFPNYQEQGFLFIIKWIVVAPLYAVLFYTIPNCKKKPQMFLLTFFISIGWIAFFSYIMVWMVTVIGFTFGIPDAIMGITLLAAGTSVPDAYTSLHVAKQGQGDMAVSNSIGSNVFDILVGLALPWFIETTIVYPGTEASINSRGLFYAIILLFLSLVVTIYLFHLNHWTLNKKLGIMMIISYFVILLMCGILEFNIIDVKNPIMCDD